MNDEIHSKLQKDPKYEIPTAVTVAWELSLKTPPVQEQWVANNVSVLKELWRGLFWAVQFTTSNINTEQYKI